MISSNSETFGQSIVEPFVAGLCIVTRNVGIAKDIIINGENGFIFDTQRDLENIFLKLGRDKTLIQKCGETNWRNRDKFKWEIIADCYKKAIQDLD